MRIEFLDLNELESFLQWAGYAKRTDMLVQVAETVNTIAQAAVEVAEIAATAVTGDERVETAATAEPAKRKRRTKAEMEADREAERVADQAVTESPKRETTPAGTLAQIAPENTGNPFAQQTLPEGQESAGAPATAVLAAADPAAPAPTTDIGDLHGFVAARLAERPTVESIEHLNMARGFIARHGMPKYNETFALAGLTANIMSYTPADCARHAAVLDFLATE